MDNALNVVGSLIRNERIDLIHIFVKGSDKLTRKAINLMCTRKHIKDAAKLLKISKIDENEFPNFISFRKNQAIRYQLFSKEGGLYQFIEVIMNDLEMLAITAEILEFECKI